MIENADPPLSQWSRFRCKLLWAYDNPLVRKRWEWPYICSPTAAWLIRSGSVKLKFRDGVEHYTSGTWVFPKEEDAIQTFEEGTHLLSIRFQAEWDYAVPVLSRARSVAFPQEEAPRLARDAGALVDFVARHFPEAKASSYVLRGDFGFYLELQPILMQWISSYYATLTQRGVPMHNLEVLDERVISALQSIETRPLQVPLHTNDLAEWAGCSVSQLNKLFVKQIGMTPAAFWTRRKLAISRAELRKGRLSIKMISFSIGFGSGEHFSNWFKKHTGLTPREFRQLHSDQPKIS